MVLKIGNSLQTYLHIYTSALSVRLLNMEKIPEAAKLNYIETLIENGKLKISYLADSRKSDDAFTTTLRQSAKPVTVFKKLLPDVDLAVLNTWIDKLKTHFALPEHTINLADGDDLLYMYHINNYVHTTDSTLGASCMRYDKCQDYIQFYVKNRDVSGVFVGVGEGNRVAARALIWRATLGTRKITVLDRVYAKNTVFENILKDWSKNNCDFTIDHTTKLFHNNATGKEEYLDMYVNLNYVSEPYPYLDNFEYLMGNRLYNVFCPKISYLHLKATDGKFIFGKQAPGYAPGLVRTTDNARWTPRGETVLLRSKYELLRNVKPCVLCQKLEHITQLRQYQLNNADYFVCKTVHVKPFIIDNQEYNLCRGHGFYTTETCEGCALTPRACNFCFLYTTNFIVTDSDERVACSNCYARIICRQCNLASQPRYLMHRGPYTNEYYCNSCYVAWESCQHCDSPIEPGQEECFCEADYNVCSVCNARTHIDDLYHINSSDDEHCSNCFGTHSFMCTHCEDYILINEVSEIQDVCINCYNLYSYTCEVCNEHSTSFSGYENICVGCSYTHIRICIQCNTHRRMANPSDTTCVDCNLLSEVEF